MLKIFAEMNIDQIKTRITDLSSKFLDITDLLKEAKGLSDKLGDIIRALNSSRMGIVYELDDLRRQHESLKRTKWHSTDKRFAQAVDDLGIDIQNLVRIWQDIDRDIRNKENELRNLEMQKGQVTMEMDSIGREIERELAEMSRGDLLSTPGYGWYAKAILSSRDRDMVGAFSKEFQQTVEEFTQWMKGLEPGKIDILINEKAGNLRNLIDQIKVEENKVKKLKAEKKELEQFFGKLSSALGEELVETENTMVKISKWIQTKAPKYKEAYLFLLERVTENLRKDAEKFVDDMLDLEERMKVTVTPKASENVWEKLKGAMKKLWTSGKDLLQGLRNTNTELQDFADELETAPDIGG